jgi:hypothetical protein
MTKTPYRLWDTGDICYEIMHIVNKSCITKATVTRWLTIWKTQIEYLFPFVET